MNTKTDILRALRDYARDTFKGKEQDEDVSRTITCSHCGYEWTPRVENPKECPRCKQRLDRKPPETTGE